MPIKKRKICFIITCHTHYSRSKLVLGELQKSRDVELQIVVGGSAMLPNYGDVLSALEEDGFHHNAKITMTFEGGSHVAMAKTAGIGVSEFATVFDNLKPDVVVVRGDRYEVLSPTIAASYLNIPIAHIEGGDVTGTIDESVRHAVTKLAHIHFTTNNLARDRVIRMGEDSRYVFNVGCPSIEYIASKKFKAHKKLVNRLGVGDVIDLDKSYLMVMKHPVTTESNRKNTEILLKIIHELKIPTIWFWPNVDAGTDEISKAIRTFREKKDARHMRFHTYLPTDDYLGLLHKTVCLVGNSSVGVKECSYLGIPAVNIGSRQNGRTRGHNVVDVPFNEKQIKNAIQKQIKVGRYPKSNIYYKNGTSKQISNILRKVDLYTQKHFVD
ncbi:UDP-N-acetylglucosamine 2-epimerase (hydrolyzing) [bacterium]|nr:UDP-N-acetylglucosamine 2-epimerase (hydrolyzing) [bacterium]|tara:strand:+ start:9451 stop:10599 length:1149 start_codon:yes stop_codon:yes gene_type:complete